MSSIKEKPQVFGAAGFIVFNKDGKTILVRKIKKNKNRTCHKKGSVHFVKERNGYSFPKGRKEPGENDEQNALRELMEETGIKKSQIEIIPGKFIDESLPRDDFYVRYFIAKFVDENEHKFTFDEKELEEVRWYTIEEALKVQTFELRNEILKEAQKIYSEHFKYEFKKINLPIRTFGQKS